MTQAKKRKPLAMVLVGLPGCGKSTWAKHNPKKLPVASTDFFIEKYAAEKKTTYAKAFKKHYPAAQKLMQAQVGDFVKAKKSFIWDQTNLTKKERDAIYKILSPSHEVHMVCFYVPLEVCLDRFKKRKRDGGDIVDEKRIRKLAETADFPQKGDLCEKIVLLIHPAWPKGKKVKQKV